LVKSAKKIGGIRLNIYRLVQEVYYAMYQLLSEIKKQEVILSRLVRRINNHRKPVCDTCKVQVEDSLVYLKNYLTDKNKELQNILNALDDPRIDCPCDRHESEPVPAIRSDSLYGFAYSHAESAESGTIQFQVASPLHHEVNYSNDGLQVTKKGIYQVSYSVSCKVESEATNPAIFKIVVNDSFTTLSSVIKSYTTQLLSSTQLIPLMEGDVVRLVAEVSDGYVYSNPSLQIVMVAQ